jgi:hypothetical protein
MQLCRWASRLAHGPLGNFGAPDGVRATSSFVSRALGLGWALAAFATAVGCGDERAPTEEPVTPDVRVVLGTGRTQFEPLDDEMTIPLIKGVQGGMHVWTSFLAYGFDTDVLRMDVATGWEGVDESVVGRGGNVAVRPTSDASGAPALTSVGWPAIIYDASCAHGNRVRVDITVLDGEGRSASDTRQWIMEVPEADRSGDCGG